MSNLIRLALTLAMLAATLFAPTAMAQTTLRADWTNLGKGNLQAVNNGETLTVGPNTVTINTQVVTDGDGNDANFTNFYSTGMLSYYGGQLSSQTGGLFYSMDHSIFDAGDYFQTTYTLGTAVTNLAFTVGNVDRFFGTDGSGNPANFHDGVIIEYDVGTGTWLNIRSLTGVVTLGSSVGTTTINGQQAYHGTAYSGGITSTNGDIRVNFGTLTVKRVRIRYLFGQASPTTDPSGNWQYIGLSDFTWQQAGVNTSDLSLSKTVSNATPTSGSTVSYTLSLTNSGANSASNVVVSDTLPAGFSFLSASGYGTFNSSTGRWSVPSISNGQTRTITLTGTVTAPAGITITNTAEVFSSPNYDTDSTPNNGVTTEDDYASVSFTTQGTRTAGVAPVLVCPTNVLTFNWAGRSWPEGTTANNYTLTGLGAFNWSISSPAPFLSIAAYGGIHPRLTTAAQGTTSLSKAIDFNTRDEFATTTVTLGDAVDGAQFVIFDVDYAANDFADRVKVYGRLNGATVIPVLTNGASNYVIGNEAFGDLGSDDTSSAGNVTVTFNQPVDTIIIEYGNYSAAPANPDGQAIQMSGNISICEPEANLSVTKTSLLLSDPVNGTSNPYAIPGATLRYCLLLSNSGTADASNVVASDTLPGEVTYVANSIRSGTGCSSASTAEDDDNTGADETDPIGASFTSGVIEMLVTAIGNGESAAVTFEVTVD